MVECLHIVCVKKEARTISIDSLEETSLVQRSQFLEPGTQ